MYVDKYANDPIFGVPMEIVMARHRAVLKRKCCCGSKKDPVEKGNKIRRWIGCDRCLGVIKQLN